MLTTFNNNHNQQKLLKTRQCIENKSKNNDNTTRKIKYYTYCSTSFSFIFEAFLVQLKLLTSWRTSVLTSIICCSWFMACVVIFISNDFYLYLWWTFRVVPSNSMIVIILQLFTNLVIMKHKYLDKYLLHAFRDSIVFVNLIKKFKNVHNGTINILVLGTSTLQHKSTKYLILKKKQ